MVIYLSYGRAESIKIKQVLIKTLYDHYEGLTPLRQLPNSTYMETCNTQNNA